MSTFYNGPRHSVKYAAAMTGSSSASPNAPTATPLPHPPQPDQSQSDESQAPAAAPISKQSQTSTSAEDSAPCGFALPKLRLQFGDLIHPGSAKFQNAIDIFSVFPRAVSKVQRLLYVKPSDLHTHVPPTRSVTLLLRDIGGVAYTTGSDLDSDHKEIHLSLEYVANIKPELVASEIEGVLTHELVHCYQWDANGTCPSGLIEGVADWVRLRCGLIPPHWKGDLSGSWDKGYQHTAYFLEYLEGRFGYGTVRRLNEKLRLHKYEVDSFWIEFVGKPVEQLWDDYQKEMGAQTTPAGGENAFPL